MTSTELELLGFKKVYIEPFIWQFDADGYYFKSDGKTIEWDDIDGVDRRKPLKIKTIRRFSVLMCYLTGDHNYLSIIRTDDLIKGGVEYDNTYTRLRDLNDGDEYLTKSNTKCIYVKSLGDDEHLVKNIDDGDEYSVPHGGYPIYRKLI